MPDERSLGQPLNQTKKRSEETEPNYYFSQFRQDLLSVMRLENPVRNRKLPIPILINDRSRKGGHSAFKNIKWILFYVISLFPYLTKRFTMFRANTTFLIRLCVCQNPKEFQLVSRSFFTLKTCFIMLQVGQKKIRYRSH